MAEATAAALLTEMKPVWRDRLTGEDVSREYLAGFIRRNRDRLETMLEPIVERLNYVPVARPVVLLEDIPEPKLGDKVPTPPKAPRGASPWRPTWATNSDGRMPVWAQPPINGLAIQITPHQASKRSKIEWWLAILHLGTGFTVVSSRAGHLTTPIEWSVDNFRHMQGLMADLLAMGSWEIELTPEVLAVRRPLIARCSTVAPPVPRR